MKDKYTWVPTSHGHISVRYLDEEIGEAKGITKALAIETSHRSERKNEAHHLFREHRQQVRNSGTNQRKRF